MHVQRDCPCPHGQDSFECFNSCCFESRRARWLESIAKGCPQLAYTPQLTLALCFHTSPTSNSDWLPFRKAVDTERAEKQRTVVARLPTDTWQAILEWCLNRRNRDRLDSWDRWRHNRVCGGVCKLLQSVSRQTETKLTSAIKASLEAAPNFPASLPFTAALNPRGLGDEHLHWGMIQDTISSSHHLSQETIAGGEWIEQLIEWFGLLRIETEDALISDLSIEEVRQDHSWELRLLQSWCLFIDLGGVAALRHGYGAPFTVFLGLSLTVSLGVNGKFPVRDITTGYLSLCVSLCLSLLCFLVCLSLCLSLLRDTVS